MLHLTGDERKALMFLCGLLFVGVLLRAVGYNPAAGSAVAAQSSVVEPLSVQPLDINMATAAQLVLLPGIGPELAERIVRSREETGPFTGVDDLQRVKGIGQKKLQALNSRIVCR
jgi:competence protein ComEA